VVEYDSDPDFIAPESLMRRISFKTAPTRDEKHGQIGGRDYAVSGDVRWLIERHPDWKTIRTVGITELVREVREEVKTERRFFVSSPEMDAEVFAKAVRVHLGIENSLHYVPDMAFVEDDCRTRKDNGNENMAFIRKIALTVSRSGKESKSSLLGRIKEMAWSDKYIEKLLFNSDFAA